MEKLTETGNTSEKMVNESTPSESLEEILGYLTEWMVEAHKREAKWPLCPTCHKKYDPGTLTGEFAERVRDALDVEIKKLLAKGGA